MFVGRLGCAVHITLISYRIDLRGAVDESETSLFAENCHAKISRDLLEFRGDPWRIRFMKLSQLISITLGDSSTTGCFLAAFLASTASERP